MTIEGRRTFRNRNDGVSPQIPTHVGAGYANSMYDGSSVLNLSRSLLELDDLGLIPLLEQSRRDLLEIFDDR